MSISVVNWYALLIIFERYRQHMRLLIKTVMRRRLMSNFKLIEERFINEIEAKGRLYLHEKSGAKLFAIENNDDNRVFSISFKTPPTDNTGLTHILEHSVLSGSKNFPTKEPFVDLAKGSLNTFLNALTFSDKTMYPIASKNEKDFYNLMEVYLDAVFYPNIYRYKEIFEQEGWHYDLNSMEEDITYKGVVYNEMLGAFSSPEEILFSRIMEVLYPNNCYGYEAGGDPEHIPELDYEAFLNYHKKYYHPSNCYIYLYGNGKIDEMLEVIDKKYLCKFDRGYEATIDLQEHFEAKISKTMYYPVSSEEEEEDGTYLSLNYVTGKATDSELSIALDILEYILLETPASPLKKTLIESDIGRDVIGNFDQGILQPMFNIVVKDSNLSEKDKFIRLTQNTLKKLVNNGIDRKLIEASINSLEFKLREANGDDTPKGLLYGIRCMDSWLYNNDPFIHLQYEKTLSSIKEKANNGYFEQLIQKYFIENTHSAFVALVPQKKLSDERANREAQRLEKYKDSLTKDALAKLLENNKKLRERQITPDSEEELSKIPLLSLSDISEAVKTTPMEEKRINGTKILHHISSTNGIVYLDLFFDTSAIEENELYYMALLSDVLSMLPTKKYSYGDLSNEIDIHTGGIGFDVDAYEEIDSGNIKPMFIVQAKALDTKLEELFSLLEEILNFTRFRNKKRILEIIREIKSDIEMDFIDEGHGLAVKKLCSYFSGYANYMEKLSGITYYNFVVELEENYDTLYRRTVDKLEKICRKIFTKENLTSSIVCNNKNYEQFSEVYPQFVDKLLNKVWKKAKYNLEPVNKNEGIINTGNIQHVAAGYNFKALGYNYNGHMQVLKNILSLDYLWKRIRLQEGAYGVFARFEMSGNAYFVSYRDPGLKNTLQVFNGISEFVKNFDISDREMRKYIIGTISGLDQPLSPEQAGQRNAELYFRNIKPEIMQREREEILTTDPDKIRELAPLIQALMEQKLFCVVGSESAINNNRDLFDKIYNVFDNNPTND